MTRKRFIRIPAPIAKLGEAVKVLNTYNGRIKKWESGVVTALEWFAYRGEPFRWHYTVSIKRGLYRSRWISVTRAGIKRERTS